MCSCIVELVLIPRAPWVTPSWECALLYSPEQKGSSRSKTAPVDVLAKVSEYVTLYMASGSTQRGMIKVSRMKASPHENDVLNPARTPLLAHNFVHQLLRTKTVKGTKLLSKQEEYARSEDKPGHSWFSWG